MALTFTEREIQEAHFYLYMGMQMYLSQQTGGEPLPLQTQGKPVSWHQCRGVLSACAPDDSKRLPFMFRGKAVRKEAWAMDMLRVMEEKGFLKTDRSWTITFLGGPPSKP